MSSSLLTIKKTGHFFGGTGYSRHRNWVLAQHLMIATMSRRSSGRSIAFFLVSIVAVPWTPPSRPHPHFLHIGNHVTWTPQDTVPRLECFALQLPTISSVLDWYPCTSLHVCLIVGLLSAVPSACYPLMRPSANVTCCARTAFVLRAGGRKTFPGGNTSGAVKGMLMKVLGSYFENKHHRNSYTCSQQVESSFVPFLETKPEQLNERTFSLETKYCITTLRRSELKSHSNVLEAQSPSKFPKWVLYSRY